MLSITQSPIWMDSSTAEHCHQLESLLGGPHKVAELTGSSAYERFTIHQIRKLAVTETDAIVNQTERISLVSSFICSLLIGNIAPIDVSDASGMNAMDIHSKSWVPAILENTIPANNNSSSLLESMLDKPVPSHQIVGNVSQYLVSKYGFNPNCTVVAFSGDNPCSLAGLRMQEGDIAVSLGTSDTIFGPLKNPHPSIEGHVFCNPIDSEHSYMALLCYKNGSLTREHVRNEYSNGSWEKFNDILATKTTVSNDGLLGFYFIEPEITPKIRPGIHRFDIHDQLISEFPQPESNIRAIIENQFLSMYSHSLAIGMHVTKILVTGGASRNSNIVQILSDVFGVPVFAHSQPNSACLGAAYRALHGWLSRDKFVDFSEVAKRGVPFQKVAEPNTSAHEKYQSLLLRFQKLEEVVKNL